MLTATPAGAEFEVCGGTQQRQLSLLPPHAASLHVLSVLQTAGAQVSLHLPLPSLFWPLPLTQHSTWSDLLAEGGAALKNGWINKQPLGQDQPADCQVFHLHVHRGNNLVINPGGTIHSNGAQVSFRVCPISAREGTGVLYMHPTMLYIKYRGKHVPILRDNYLKIRTSAQGSRDYSIFFSI